MTFLDHLWQETTASSPKNKLTQRKISVEAIKPLDDLISPHLCLCAMCQCAFCANRRQLFQQLLTDWIRETVWQSNFRHSYFGTFQRRSYFYFPEICSMLKIKFCFSYGLMCCIVLAIQFSDGQSHWAQKSSWNIKVTLFLLPKNSQCSLSKIKMCFLMLFWWCGCLPVECRLAFPPFSRHNHHVRAV